MVKIFGMWYMVTQGNWNVLHPVKILGMWYMVEVIGTWNMVKIIGIVEYAN